MTDHASVHPFGRAVPVGARAAWVYGGDGAPAGDRLDGVLYQAGPGHVGAFYVSFRGTTIPLGFTEYAERQTGVDAYFLRLAGKWAPGLIPDGSTIRVGPGGIWVPPNTAFSLWYVSMTAGTPRNVSPMWSA